jgi:hypothetical protein
MGKALCCAAALVLVVAPLRAAAQLDSATRARGLLESVPLELVGNRILITVAVDSSGPLTYIFDTGVSGTMMNARTARSLGIQGKDTVQRRGFTGPFRVVRSAGHTVRVGSLRLDDITLGIADLGQIERAEGRRVDGIIGGHLLSRYAVRIDLDSARLEFLDNQRFTYDLDRSRSAAELRGADMLVGAAVTLEDGSRVTGPVFLDTGSPGTITFNAWFAGRNDLLSRVPSLCERSAAGAGGERWPVRAVMLRGLALGDLQWGSIPGDAVVPRPGVTSASRTMGILGMEILRRFNVFIDVGHRRVFLEPNGLRNEPLGSDCSGLSLETDSAFEKVLIREVHDGSPACEAGLEPGDEIVQFNGRRASELTLEGLRRVLRDEWTELELVVSRRGETRTFRLRRAAPS